MLLTPGGERLLELAFPDEAPRSNHVGYDVDLQNFVVHGVTSL
jgi:hypothetical protein